MTAIIALVVLVIVVAVRGDVDVDATDIKPKDAVRRVPQRFAVFGYVGQVESDVDGQKPFDYEAPSKVKPCFVGINFLNFCLNFLF